MGEKYKFIIFLIIAVCFLGYYKMLAKAEGKTPVMASAVGTITRMNTSDSGNTWFYIQFYVNGVLYEGQTIKYVNFPKNTKIGDQVNFSYYVTPKNHCVCEINEEGFVSVRDSGSKGYKKIFLALSIVFLLLFVVFLIKSFI